MDHKRVYGELNIADGKFYHKGEEGNARKRKVDHGPWTIDHKGFVEN